jgi:ADP-ribosylglycohydrolase
MLEGEDDETHISRLGAGWTGDEAQAIALYCSLRYEHDFTAGIRAAVMHSGDSDSTGAITGNILGAWLGASAIDKAWLEPLELRAIIEILANDLLVGIPTKETDPYLGKVWRRRYIGGHLV